MEKVCPSCGARIEAHIKFCTSCGRPQPAIQPATPDLLEADPAPPPTRPPPPKKPSVLPIIFLLIFAAVGFDICATERKHAAAAQAAHVKANAPHPVTHSEVIAPTPVRIKSCTCAMGDGRTTPLVEVKFDAPPTGATKPWQIVVTSHPLGSSFRSETSNYEKTASPDAVFPVTSMTEAARMGVACDNGIVALVSGSAVTAWSTRDGSVAWKAALTNKAIDGADAGSSSSAADYDVGCAHLPMKNGVATIQLADGKTAALTLKDGTLK